MNYRSTQTARRDLHEVAAAQGGVGDRSLPVAARIRRVADLTYNAVAVAGRTRSFTVAVLIRRVDDLTCNAVAVVGTTRSLTLDAARKGQAVSVLNRRVG
jgi:hypothetical protein